MTTVEAWVSVAVWSSLLSAQEASLRAGSHVPSTGTHAHQIESREALGKRADMQSDARQTGGTHRCRCCADERESWRAECLASRQVPAATRKRANEPESGATQSTHTCFAMRANPTVASATAV